jgi:hypothetical protein
VLKENKTNAQMIAFIEEIGAGPAFDRLPAQQRTTPHLRNLLSRVAREEDRRDTDGTPIGDRFVQEAAATVRDPEPPRPWDDSPPFVRPHDAALRLALGVDGWTIEAGLLLPVTPVPLDEARSRVRSSLAALSAEEALRRLDQLEAGLDEGHWESANADARAFLNAVFEIIAAKWPATSEKGLREGAARIALQQTGFFKPDGKGAGASYEGDLIKAIVALFGSDGAHTGSSDPDATTFRYALAILSSDYFLKRVLSGVR